MEASERRYRAHSFMRDRTQGSDFSSFFSAHGGSRTSFPVALVCFSGYGQGVFLVVARVRFLVKPTFFGACCRRRLPGGDSRSPLKEAELTYHGFFLGKHTHVHGFVFLSCPIPFCKSIRYTRAEDETSWEPDGACR